MFSCIFYFPHKILDAMNTKKIDPFSMGSIKLEDVGF